MEEFSKVKKVNSESCIGKLAPNASLWKRFKRFMHKLIIISEWNDRRIAFFLSHGSVLEERKKHITSKYWYFIHPFSLITKYREIFMVCLWFVLLANEIFTVAMTYRVAEYRNIHVLRSVIIVTNMMCLIDVVLNFFTGFVHSETGMVIMEPGKIAIHYLRTWFFIDIICVIVLIWVLLPEETKAASRQLTGQIDLIGFLRYMRLARIATALIHFRWITDFLKLSYETYVALCLIILIMYVVHFNACLYILIPDMLNRDYSYMLQSRNASWIIQLKHIFTKVQLDLSPFYVYLHSIRECLYKLSVGPKHGITPRNFEEILLSFIFLIISYFLQIGILVTLYFLMESFYFGSCNYSIGRQQLITYCAINQIPKKSRNKLLEYYRCRYENHLHPFHFDDFTATIHFDLIMELWRPDIETSYSLKEIPSSLKIQLAPHFIPKVFMANSIIYTFDEIARDLYFLCAGTVAIYDQDGKELCHVYEGMVFGMTDLEQVEPVRTTAALAIENCEVFTLSRRILSITSNKTEEYRVIIDKLQNNLYSVNSEKKQKEDRKSY